MRALSGWVFTMCALVACGRKQQEPADLAADPAPRTPIDAAVAQPNPAAQCDQLGQDVCVGDNIVPCLAGGMLGEVRQRCPDGCRNGVCQNTCETEGNELIYLVDSENNFLRFDPRKLPGDPFERVGELDCGSRDRPFSMAVDRRGIAWVLFDNGYLNRVSIIDAKCRPVGYIAPPESPRTFGMGWASDGPKSETETLYIAANDQTQYLGSLSLDEPPPTYKPIGMITTPHSRNPELTGTADGKLFAYFPEDVHGFVQELDKTRGIGIGPRHQLDRLTGQVSAYAFAHFAGTFYVFATSEAGNTVHAVDRKTGKSELLIERSPYRVVGAGVSTCAPLLEAAP